MNKHMMTTGLLIATLSLGVLSVRADYDVLVVREGESIERYAVSADGNTWTKSETAFVASTPGTSFATARQLAAVGDGYIYVATGSTIERYLPDATPVGTWKSGLSKKYRIVASPDRVWFYVGNDWNTASEVARYRISDPSIGGALNLNNSSHGGVNWNNNRQFVVGRDGLIYFPARSGNVDDASGQGVNNPLRGVFVYDATLADVPRVHRYRVPGNNNGIALVVDDDNEQVYTIYGNNCRVFCKGVADCFTSGTPGSGNPFSSVDLGAGGKFFGNYDGNNAANGKVYKLNPLNGSFKAISLGITKINSISDVTAAATTDSQLPNINGVWYMNEARDSTTLANGAQPGTWNMTLSGDLAAGARGAVRGGLVSRDGGYGVITASTQIVPQTGNFTIGLWVCAMNGTARTLLSNGAATLAVGANGRPSFTAGGATVTGNASIWDGWHWLVVRRNGGNLELWVDNSLKATQALDPTAGIDQIVSWTLGANTDGGNSSGLVFFDELRIYPVLLTTGDMTLLYDLVKPSAPKAPIGSEISAVSLDGTCYTAFEGKAYASSDGGATWTEKGAIGLDAASLFVSGGNLYAAGRNAAGSLALATASGGGASWNVVRIGEGLAVPMLVATQPVVSGGRVWLGTPSSGMFNPMLVSFAFSGGAASDPQLALAKIPPDENNSVQLHEWLTSVVAAVMTNGTICTLGTSKPDEKGQGEFMLLATNTAANAIGPCGVMGFPGGSKPVSAVWDETTRRYWMVTAACHHGNRSSSLFPNEQANSLALYSSDDLFNWRYHQDVTVQGCAFYHRPSAMIHGDDLVVVFLESPRATVFRTATFANFRTHWTRLSSKARGFHKQELFLTDEDNKLVWKFYHDAATDDWIPAGIFCRGGVYGGGALNLPMNVCAFGNSVFINTASSSFGIFEFDKYGTFLRYYPTPNKTDGFSVSLDGTKLLATEHWGTNIYIVDRETGTVTTKNFGSALVVPRGIADIGDGKMAITSRGTCQFLIYDPSADTYAAYGTADFPNWNQNPGASDGPMDLHFDAQTGRLWMFGSACGLGYYDMQAGTFTRVDANRIFYHGLTFWKDSILASVFSPSRVLKITPVAGQTVYADSISYISIGRRLNRIAIVDMPQIEDGTTIIFR